MCDCLAWLVVGPILAAFAFAYVYLALVGAFGVYMVGGLVWGALRHAGRGRGL